MHKHMHLCEEMETYFKQDMYWKKIRIENRIKVQSSISAYTYIYIKGGMGALQYTH